MEPLFGCFAVVIVLVLVAGPIVALALALQARGAIRDLSARIVELQAQVEVLRRRLAREGVVPPAPDEPPTAAHAVRPETRPASPAPPVAPPPPAPAQELPDEAPVPQPEAAPAPVFAAAETAPAEPSSPAPAAPGLEERLGARLPVWLGGIALAAAGAFLVKYSVDQGFLSPPVRVALGLIFGIALLGLGEKLRGGSARIAQALSAAGVAVLYAVLLAGVRLYGLIPPLVGFVLMAANTAVAVLLSLRQGPMVALLGLVGGFATPALVSQGAGEVRGLMTYLLVLDVGLVAVTRRRRWPLLALGALAGSLGWVALWLAGPYREGHSVVLGLFLVASTFAFAGRAFARRGAPEPGGEEPAARWLPALAAAGATALLGVVVGVAGYGALEWGLFVLLAAGCFALAARRDELFGLAPFATAAAFALFAVWGFDLAPTDARRFVITLLVVGGGAALAAWAIGTRAVRPARWSVLAAAGWMLFPALGYASTRDLLALPWALLAVALGFAAVALAVPYARRRGATSEGEAALAALAVAATAHASFALPLALDRIWLSVGFALEVPLLMALARRLRVDALSRLALGAGAIAAARLLLNPGIVSYEFGSVPLLNGLLWGYGAPAAALALAAAIARDRDDESSARCFEAGAAAFAFALVTLEVAHAHGGGSLAHAPDRWSIAQWGSQAVAWLVVGLAFVELGRRRERVVLSIAGRIAIALAGAQALLVHGVVRNPAWTLDAVGATPVLNLLLWSFGVPAALLLVAARRIEAEGGAKLPTPARVAAALLAFALVTLEVRQLFRGSVLSVGDASNAEQFGYSAAWALFGTGLLVLGIARSAKPLRLAALAVMLIAVLKVFLFDTSELEGLYRVFSFLGLGAALLALAHLYQRYVFRPVARP
jgi:uncharacterized membrane protein